MDVNVMALVLHLMGDVFSSVVVLGGRRCRLRLGHAVVDRYADPGASLVIVVIIFVTTVPAFRRVVGVLMQAAPASVKPEQLTAALCAVDGVASVHELHVWQLVDGTNIGTVHVVWRQRRRAARVQRRARHFPSLRHSLGHGAARAGGAVRQ
jgi:cation diffusion facilitator family transporter